MGSLLFIKTNSWTLSLPVMEIMFPKEPSLLPNLTIFERKFHSIIKIYYQNFD